MAYRTNTDCNGFWSKIHLCNGKLDGRRGTGEGLRHPRGDSVLQVAELRGEVRVSQPPAAGTRPLAEARGENRALGVALVKEQ